MIARRIRKEVEKGLGRQASVALLGPRQVGKTTLARSIADEEAAIYLDLEWPEDRQKLADPAFFLSRFEKLAGHPVVGSSWEGFAIENILAAVPDPTRASFYRTSAGAEVDLLLELPGHPKPWAIEIKQSSVPKASRGFYESLKELTPERAFILYGGEAHYPVSDGIEAIGLRGICDLLSGLD